MKDIVQLQSDLKKAELRILELETNSTDNPLFVNMFNSSPVPFGLSNKDGTILNINTTFIKTFGYDIKDIPTVSDWWPLAYPDVHYREWVVSIWDRRLAESQQTNTDFEPIEVNIKCKDGTKRVVLISAAPLKGSYTEVFLVIFYDITEMKKAKNKIGDLSHSLANMTASIEHQNIKLLIEKEKAEASAERLKLAMLGANDGLWDWDLAGDKIYFSPRWKSMLGFAEDEIIDHYDTWRDLVHPEDVDKAIAQIQDFMDKKVVRYESEFRMRHKDGQYINILSRAFAVESEEGKITRLVGTHIDITERKKAEEQLNYQSSHDSLTGLVNRREFERRTEQLLFTSKKQNQLHALCYMDLDQFKVVNDTCGHAAGDEMLRQISALLKEAVRDNDTLARLGGDEFGVLMEHCSPDNAYRVTRAIQAAIQEYQFVWENRTFRAGVSIGLVQITDKTNNLTELLKVADVACYMAKDKGRNRIHVHCDDDSELAKRQGEMHWVTRIQHALDEDRFCLYAQMIEPLEKSSGKHFEILVRMIDEEGDIIPPGAFLPSAERYNLMRELDKWVIRNALSSLRNHPEFLNEIDFISINLSGQSITDERFLEFVLKEVRSLKDSAKKICFEITETAAISNLLLAGKFISELRKFGCRFALDDFGSGLSSFGYLKNLAVDYLKIDGAFVKDIVCDPIDRAMVKSINEIGQVMGMETIAEFVESEEIKTMLKEIGVDYAQGFAIHKPQPFIELLNEEPDIKGCNNSTVQPHTK